MKQQSIVKAQATSNKLQATSWQKENNVSKNLHLTINDSRFTFLLFTFSFLFCLSAMAQKQFNYDTAWKKVSAAQEKGLPKTASEEVNKIYTAAKNGKDEAQQIKALVFQATLSQNTTENSQIKTIQKFETEMKTAVEPVRSILAAISADAYWNYLQQNRYKFYNRTATTNFNKDSVDTWAIADFTKRISDLYAASVANKSILQKVKLDAFEPIIIKGNARKLRPTLYDLLAHKALDYYKTEEYDVIKPAYAFTLNDPAVLADAKDFIQYKSATKDSTSLQWKAVQLFQSLIQFHLADSPFQGMGASAFIDVDIERISWIYQKAVMAEKEQLYRKALENIYNKYPNNEEAMQAGYLLAAWWQQKAANYKAGGTEEDRLGYVKAIEIAKSVFSKFPKIQWANNSQNLINTITKKDIQITVEKVNEPNKVFRALVKYRNASEVNLAIVPITAALKASIENGAYDDNVFWISISKAQKQKTWNQALPTTTDYREHSAEIAIDAVGIGEFYLLSSGDNQFSLDKNPLAAAMFYSSSISFVQNAKEVYVLDRSTGQPLANANLQVWAIRYDYNIRKNIKNKLEKLTTDKNGYAKLQQHANEDRQLQLEINWQNDHLFLNDNMNDYERNYNEYNRKYSKTAEDFERGQRKFYFFTDRSIYRPGQLVYFKAIGVTKDFTTLKTKLVQSKNPFSVTLYNANNQKVETLELIANEYGSINGKFKLPENLLNGQFSLLVAGGMDVTQYYFSVEEYKRPKFLVDFDTVKGSYHINDDVKIIGNAKAYAGNKVDGAAVKYRVKRTVRFLYPWMWWRRPIPTGGEMEITNGETVTKADGTFEIVFKAIPDLTLAKETDPVFDYSVTADVTDINGETRSITTLVPVGYKALELKVSISGITNPAYSLLPVDSFKNLSVSSKNLSGQFEPVKTSIKIYQLNTPDRLLRKRYWDAPDTVVMDYKTFIQKFPNDPYRDEQDFHSWEKGKEILTQDFTTEPSAIHQLPTANFSQGWYIVEATATDKFGQPVKAVEWFQLYDMKRKDLPAKEYNWGGLKFQSFQPGETANFLAGTSANNLFVVQQTLKAQGGWDVKPIVTTNFLSLNNEKNTASFPVTEADRGGYYVNRIFVKDNRIYTSEWYINVPFTNKQLDISFNTFRDKLQPGAEEKWSVTIKGSKGEKVAAEMLASMYDASLDQFKPHTWTVPAVWPINNFNSNWNGNVNFSQQVGRIKYWYENVSYRERKIYDALLSLNVYNNYQIYGSRSGTGQVLRGRLSGIVTEDYNKSFTAAPMAMMKVDPSLRENKALADDGNKKDLMDSVMYVIGNKNENQPEPDFSNVTIRKNFNETAFFFPDLHTDDEGNISFSFTMPEALTKWKLQTLAHTKELAFGFAQKTTVTQKDLMIQPNAPRFLREGDRMEFSAKIVNLTDKEITGQSQLQLVNTATNENVDGPFHNMMGNQYFTIPAGQSVAVKFPMEVPFNYNSAVSYRIVAKAGAVSDGEEAAMPVLTNRMLVTETMPLNLRNTNSKDFKFEKLLNSKTSTSLSNEALTVEFTSNPTWYAVQALPYLMEYPYECAEQSFNRFYANALAAKIANSTPKIKAIFEQWAAASPLQGMGADTAALMSNLEKNQELKSALLEETPWVLAAQNESQQKKNIGLLFDMVRLSNQADKTMAKLKDMQSSNGGFVWFKGGPDDRYITQYIITKIGHLRKLGAWPSKQAADLQAIVDKALPYLDARIKDDYDYLVQHKIKLSENHLSSIAIQYLYMHSFFPENPIASASQTAVSYYKKQAQQYWLNNGKYEQGMIALALNRSGDAVTPKAIIKSLKENSINSEEFGMYWKELNEGGYYWWQAPIETQSLLIEAFVEIDKNQTTIDDLKTWLLKQKQTQNWHTTKATSDACYALLLQGSNWLNVEKNVTIKLGNKTISSDKTEAGTGYFKQRIDGKDVLPSMGNINVTTKEAVGLDNSPSRDGGKSPLQGTGAWGAIYWQYFEDLDKITSAKTPLSLAKKLFIEKNSDKGPVLTPINDGDEIKVGDKVKVRIELRVDRNMEYVHMKDMRAACMEPTNVISQYKYQDGLGYYESTKDASTNFFFSYLNKGVYVFEYPLNVTLRGNFSNGITTIQCMYAPEFTSHSEGVRVNVK